MKTNMLKLIAYAIVVWLGCTTGLQVLAQTPKRLGPASAEEIKQALQVVEANMDSFKAHRNYIIAMGITNPLLVDKYQQWMKQYPANVTIPLAIGTVFQNATMPQAREFLLTVAAMEPQNAKVWAMLAADADMRGQPDLVREYSKKASLADPSDANYAFGYLTTFENGDATIYKQKVDEFIQRFPADERGAQALHGLGLHSMNLNDRIRYFEELYRRFPPHTYKWAASRMAGLVDTYLQTDPQKALVVIKEIDGQGDTDWQLRKQAAYLLIEIDQFEQAKRYQVARLKLDQVQLPRFNYMGDFVALKKASLLEQAGDVQGAYQSLSVNFAKLPTDPLYNALTSYGKQLGKDQKQIDGDIAKLRQQTATTAYPFALGLYTSNDTLRLSALKGKVILLTFWFPGCGPCLKEFPYFQTVVDSFKGENLVYLGVNVTPLQDGYVLPFIKNKKYSFIPLRGSASFAYEKYGRDTQPANFLIDQEGRIIFQDFYIANTNQRTLELMISSLLHQELARK